MNKAMPDIPLKACYASLRRINRKKFYPELIELGFASEDAAEIASWIKTIFEIQPTFFLRKRTYTVRACLAFIGSKIYQPEQTLNRRIIADFYGIKDPSHIYRFYKEYLSILEQVKPLIRSLIKKSIEERARKPHRSPRDRLNMLSDVLKAAGEGASKSAILWTAKLGPVQQETYLEAALELGYLTLDNRNYTLTEEGQKFLNAYSLFSEENSKIQD